MKTHSNIVPNICFIILVLITFLNGCITKKDLTRIEEQLEENEKEIKKLQKDNDADGVADYKDLEPDSSPEARVDNKGITLDSDNDGIPDHLDNCPFVPGPSSGIGCPSADAVEMTIPPKRDDEFWPIPKATTFETVTEDFNNLSYENTLEDVYVQLRSKIKEKGKEFHKIMYVPLGFALFTKLERINDNGLPVKDPIAIESGGCSISQIIHCLFGAPSGRYRIFAFIVSGINEIGMAIEDTDYRELIKTISSGYDYNSTYLRTVDNEPIFFGGYNIHLIVYEYETYPGNLPKLVTKSNIPHYKQIF